MKLLGLILLLTYTGCSSPKGTDETWDLLYIADEMAEITPDPKKNWGEDEC